MDRRNHRAARATRCRPVVASVVALTACSVAEPDDSGTAFARTLERIDGPFGGYVEFVDRAALEGAPQTPEDVTLVVGRQDADSVRSSATAAGWAGEDELHIDCTRWACAGCPETTPRPPASCVRRAPPSTG